MTMNNNNDIQIITEEIREIAVYGAEIVIE